MACYCNKMSTLSRFYDLQLYHISIVIKCIYRHDTTAYSDKELDWMFIIMPQVVITSAHVCEEDLRVFSL